jgi:flavin reductase (DIM6/NTAB) family NADH-FMN oxidoreductase RutF
MHYEPGVSSHGLPFDPFKSCVIPRPIGWISTRSRGGRDNLAPFSQFNNVSFDPPMVMFAANQSTIGARKDTVVNVESTGQFVWNMATWGMREAVNITAEELPHGVDEFERANLVKLPSLRVAPPRVGGSPVHFECEYIQTVRLPGNGAMGTVDVVFGRVCVIHIDDAALTSDGKIDVLKLRPIARMGYYDYTSIESRFEMIIPGNTKVLVGLEGAAGRS